MQPQKIAVQQFQKEKAENFVKLTEHERVRTGMFIPFAIASIPNDCQSLVDLGCGNAYYHQRILQERKSIKQIIGLDLSKTMLAMISEKNKANDCTQYIEHDLTLPFPLKNKVECMMTIFTIEYMNEQNLSLYIQNCFNGLLENGKLILVSMDFLRLYSLKLSQELFPYQMVTEGVQEGDKGLVKISDKGFQAEVICWKNQTLINLMQKHGFQASCEFVTAQIFDKSLFKEEEINQLISLNLIRKFIGIKK